MFLHRLPKPPWSRLNSAAALGVKGQCSFHVWTVIFQSVDVVNLQSRVRGPDSDYQTCSHVPHIQGKRRKQEESCACHIMASFCSFMQLYVSDADIETMIS